MASPGYKGSTLGERGINPISFDDYGASVCRQASWQYALWLLAPLALNTMFQPSGNVLGFADRYGFALRSSPIICAFDTLMVLFMTLYRNSRLSFTHPTSIEMAQFHSAIPAALRQDSLFKNLQRNRLFRLSLFSFTALPQAVQLYRVHELFWTRVWATMFLFCFVFTEMTILRLGHESQHPVEKDVMIADFDRFFHSLGPWVLDLDTFLCICYSGFSAFKATLVIWATPLTLSVTIYVLIIFSFTMVLSAGVRRNQLFKDHHILAISSCIALPIVLSIKAFSIIEANFAGRVGATTFNLIYLQLFLSAALISFSTGYYTWGRLAQDNCGRSGRGIRQGTNESSGAHLLWIHFATALICYSFD